MSLHTWYVYDSHTLIHTHTYSHEIVGRIIFSLLLCVCVCTYNSYYYYYYCIEKFKVSRVQMHRPPLHALRMHIHKHYIWTLFLEKTSGNYGARIFFFYYTYICTGWRCIEYSLYFSNTNVVKKKNCMVVVKIFQYILRFCTKTKYVEVSYEFPFSIHKGKLSPLVVVFFSCSTTMVVFIYKQEFKLMLIVTHFWPKILWSSIYVILKISLTKIGQIEGIINLKVIIILWILCIKINNYFTEKNVNNMSWSVCTKKIITRNKKYDDVKIISFQYSSCYEYE